MISKLIYSPLRWGILLSLLTVQVYAQSPDFSQKFQEAVRLDEEGELSQSRGIWTQLATENPENANVNYKAGRAFLQSFNRKSAALPFFKNALKGKVTTNYDRFSPSEKRVPIEIYFYYAKALHLNNNLNRASDYYQEFLMETTPKHHLYSEAELGLKQIDNAKILEKVPVEFKITNLGPIVNSEYPDFSPVISVDENALFFTSTRLRADSSNFGVVDRATGLHYEDVYATYKDRDGNWQTPELLSINEANNHTATVNVSVDGQTLYIYKNDNGDGNLYQSKLIGETWSTPEPMPAVINSPAWETHMAITPDGQTIYFVSDRKGGLGGRDIYTVKKLPDGEWGKAQNIGPVINTPYDEDAVFISPDAETLYFSSKGHDSMGGFDIMYSKKDKEGNWQAPVNIGYPINTTDDDVFFVTSADGKRAYYSSVRDSGYGEKDIYMIDLPNPQAVSLAVLKGEIIPAEGSKLPEDIIVYVTNRRTGNEQIYTPRTRDGVFIAILPPCSTYDIIYQIDGREVARDTFSIACDIDYEEINKQLILAPLLVNEDGSAQVLLANTTSGDIVPAGFTKYFGYNENQFGLEEKMYADFMASLQKIVAKKGSAEITILGSASRVPTRTFKNNQVLADKRAREAKEKILANAEKFNIDTSKLNFVKVSGAVQGPGYKGDFREGKDKYEKYQYIEVKAQ